jgi:hypothetical protein
VGHEAEKIAQVLHGCDRMVAILGVMAGCLACAAGAAAETRTWTGAVGSDWHEAGNWSHAGVPTSADDVTVAAGVVISSTDATVRSLHLSADVQISDGRTLSISGGGPASTWSAGTISIFEAGTVENGGQLNITGDVNLVRVSGAGPHLFHNAPGGVVNSSGSAVSFSAEIDNDGTFEVSSGTLTQSGTTAGPAASTGTFVADGTLSFSNVVLGAGAIVSGTGTVRFAGGPTVPDEIGGFRLEDVIGRGGMGVIYRAQQPGLDRTVAIKVIAPEHAADARFRERFAREARLTAALDHPNIVPVYATGDDGGRLYLVMRYIAGVNLARRLKDGPLSPAEAAEIVAQVGSALDAAHERGLVHRDVKPANILLAERVYLTDFGITRELVRTAGLTQTGVFMGSVDYAAPEQAGGEAAGPAADQYALACVAYECLTGRPPCRRDHDMATLWAHVNDPPARPSSIVPELGPEVDEPFLRALAKAPEDRWASCTAFAQRLSAALGDVALGHHAEP